jgi:hypothetical protein
VRIILVSADFSKEITSTVLWLTNDYDLDISCIRLRPYRFQDKLLVDIQQILPLPEASEYQVQFRKKAAEEREGQARASTDWSRYDLHVGETTVPNLTKRALFLAAVQALFSQGIAIEAMYPYIPSRKFIRVSGHLNSDSFRESVASMQRPNGGSYDIRRYFVDDGDLLHPEGETVALSNQWAIGDLPQLDALLGAFLQHNIRYVKRVDPSTEDA